MKFRKFPRTKHLIGSRLQPGDEGMGDIPFSVIAGQNLVVTEKVDGANTGIRFLSDGQLHLQSRGHYLTGGPREKHFSLFKRWVYTHMTTFWPVLTDRYIIYGEWLYAKHTVFYNYLPHYFIEFDVFDVESGKFLSTPRRQQLLTELPIVSAKILKTGQIESLTDLMKLIDKSNFIIQDINPEQDTIMEGLYIKIEDDNYVQARYKYVCQTFRDMITESGTHWLSRTIIPNILRDGVDIFT